MSIFGKIRDAIFGKAHAQPAPRPTTPTAPVPGSPAGGAPTQVAPKPVSEVDVEQQLDAKPGADALNWRTSIVDLMKLIGLDASYDERKDLATELGRSDYSGSAEDNIWLHRQVMTELARNGGKVPANLRD